jgi:hypothetical protein
LIFSICFSLIQSFLSGHVERHCLLGTCCQRDLPPCPSLTYQILPKSCIFLGAFLGQPLAVPPAFLACEPVFVLESLTCSSLTCGFQCSEGSSSTLGVWVLDFAAEPCGRGSACPPTSCLHEPGEMSDPRGDDARPSSSSQSWLHILVFSQPGR